MLARPIALVLTALSVVAAWPIFFYESSNCNHYPVFTLEGPPKPNTCGFLGNVNIHSYSGGTGHSVEKLLLYSDARVCDLDVAHRAYSNYTITNATSLCASLTPTIPRAYVFIEEILGPIRAAEASTCDDALRVQN